MGPLQVIIWITVGLIMAYHGIVGMWKVDTDPDSPGTLLSADPKGGLGGRNRSEHLRGNASIDGSKRLIISDLRWSNCGSDPFKIQSLSSSPDPLVLPGGKVSYNVTVAEDIVSPVQLEVQMLEGGNGSWTLVPCIRGLGSCTYRDICLSCSTLEQSGLPCPCPIHKADFVVDSFVLRESSIPSVHFQDGSYKVSFIGTNKKQRLFCFAFTFSFVST